MALRIVILSNSSFLAKYITEFLVLYFSLIIDNPDNFEYPTTRDADGVDPVFVGRIRKNLAFENGISLWCVADNLRIGAALNTVRICKKVTEMGLYRGGEK
jgi:hypothetical protein